MQQTFLHSDWVFKNVSELPPYVRTAVQYQPWLPATVPGHVHLDLKDNGIIGDPFQRMNELGSRWVDEADWAYQTAFHWTPNPELPKRVLRFEGLDTVCKVTLNGSVIGEFDNMFLPVEIDVTDTLYEGENLLEVKFLSAIRVGDERRRAYFAEEGISEDCKQFDERAFVRKAQYMSAWDWGPRLVSCGIWQPVSLLEYAARVKSFSVLQAHLEDGKVRVTSETVTEGSGEITLRFGDHQVTSTSLALEELDLVLEDPTLWWPSGMGDQHLYEASASIQGGNTISKRIGLRTVVLEQEPDSMGETFTFLVNGKKLWARGANWIPNDSFPSKVTAEEYFAQIATCKSLGMNMLRVWGGGLYELEPFYDACDEAGLLVWQDFMYACSYYADGDEASAVAAKEAKTQILRLRDRTSLALWCGNNENLTMWQGKWGGAQSPRRFYGENLYYKVLPDLIEEFDPQRSYIPSSPIGQSADSGDCNMGKFGDSHYWDVWHGRGDWIYYQDSDTRFSSEFGFASSCSLAQWKQTIVESEWRPDSPSVRWHDKTGKEWEKFYGYVLTHYPAPETLEEWTYYSQLNQRDALRFGIEHWRRASFCQGTLIWQFNDCWPVQSWAVQDYLRLLKPAGYELSRLYADRLISLHETEDAIQVYLINDGVDPWSAELSVEAFSLTDGSSIFGKKISAELSPSARVLLDTFPLGDLSNALLKVSSSTGQVAEALTVEPKDAQFGTPEFSVDVTGSELAVSVKGIAVDLVLIDPDDPENIRPLDQSIPGARAVTLIHESQRFSTTRPPKRVSLRWLHGSRLVELPLISMA